MTSTTKILVLILSLLILNLSACTTDKQALSDGYYSAEAKTFNSDGWKDYITIYVNNGRITTVEFNAKDSSGFIRSWDFDYSRDTIKKTKSRPNKYPRVYSTSLVSLQNTTMIKPIPAAKQLHLIFTILADAAIAQSKTGTQQVAFIDVPDYSENDQ